MKTRILMSALLHLATLGIEIPASAETPLIVRLYPSVTVGVSNHNARAFTAPMTELLAEKLQLHRIDIDIDSSGGHGALLDYGKRVSEGNIHIGVLWGLEFGWVKQRYPALEPLAVALEGTEEGWPLQLMVREESAFRNLKDLQGRTCATFEKAPLMNALWLNGILEESDFDSRSYFSPTDEHATALAAFLAVYNGREDCIVVDAPTYVRHITSRPELRFRVLAKSDPFPNPVLFANPEHLRKIRPDLWRSFQAELLTIHQTDEGQQCVDFWRVERFASPDTPEFRRALNQQVARYPFRRRSP